MHDEHYNQSINQSLSLSRYWWLLITNDWRRRKRRRKKRRRARQQSHGDVPTCRSSLQQLDMTGSWRGGWWCGCWHGSQGRADDALWARITKNTDWSTGPLAHPFACSVAPLTRSLAPHYSLCFRAPLHSLVCSLAQFSHTLASGKEIDWMAILSVFLSILDHSAMSALLMRTRKSYFVCGGGMWMYPCIHMPLHNPILSNIIPFITISSCPAPSS